MYDATQLKFDSAMPVAKNPRKKVEKAGKAEKVKKEDALKGAKNDGKPKENTRKRKASSPAAEVLTAISHPSHGKVC